MAKNEAEAEAKSGGKKRLARAKVRRADDAAKGKDGKPVLSKAERSKKRKETVRNVAIATFAVVMAIAMALPSLSTIFSNNRQNQTAEEGATDDTGDAGSETRTVSESNTDAENMEIVDENYTTTITPLEDKLKEDDKDLATILNLGNGYKNWAYAASSYSSDDDLTDHVNDLFEKAIGYYDQYLKLNDSDAVRVDRALCVFYSKTSQEGIDEMTALTESSPEYGPAWANLGLMYESTYQTDKAKETYQKAAEVDADDTYGVKSFSNGRLAALNSSEIESVSGTIESTTPDVDNEAGQLLMQKLTSESKTSF